MNFSFKIILLEAELYFLEEKAFNRMTIIVLLIAVLILSLSCQQVKDIPDEIPGQLPNPVKDFTEKDNYIIGLNWYRQQNYRIAAKFWKPLAEEGDCDARYAFGLLYFDGLGVRQSYEEATRLWSESADQG
jgi:TPR repeat protein